MQDYSTSLMYYEKSFNIRQKQLPMFDIDIAASFNNLGLVHLKMNRLYPAFDYHQNSLEIRKRMLPPGHNDIIQSLLNITHVLYEQNSIDEALNYFSKALQIQKIQFDLTDHDKLVDRLKESFGPQLHHNAPRDIPRPIIIPRNPPPISTQFSHWPEYALIIHECSPSRPVIQKFDDSLFYEFITALHGNTDDQKALHLWKELLNKCNATYNNHPRYIQDLEYGLTKDIEDSYQSFDESQEALHFYEKVLFILESSTPLLISMDNARILCLDRIANIHQRNDNFELALDYLIRGLNVMQRKRRMPNEISDKMRHIGLVHMTLGNYNLSLNSFNDALTILQSNSIDPNDREIKLTLRRIDEVKEALESSTHA
ncbi:unnamed protein product [Rotaria magnacalcarata]